MKLIDKDTLVAEIKELEDEAKIYPSDFGCGRLSICKELMNFLNTIEAKEVIAEQECICNEALNRIIGGSWNVICPVNKLGLKNGDKVKVIIEAQKGE